MKINQEDNGFKPITIVLETAGEAELLSKVLGKTIGTQESNLLYNMYIPLRDATDGIDSKYDIDGSALKVIDL